MLLLQEMMTSQKNARWIPWGTGNNPYASLRNWQETPHVLGRVCLGKSAEDHACPCSVHCCRVAHVGAIPHNITHEATCVERSQKIDTKLLASLSWALFLAQEQKDVRIWNYVMVHFYMSTWMCQHGSVSDTWLNIVLDISVRVFLNENNIWIHGPSKAEFLF